MPHPNDPPPAVESETLARFQAPVLLITYEGIKKVNITGIEKFDLLTSAGTIPKINIVCCLLADAAGKLGAALYINREVEARELRTHKDPKKRPKVKGVRPMRKIAGKKVKVTLRSGHMLFGIPIEYNQFNFTMHVKDQLVLVYRHAVYAVEVWEESEQ